MARPRNPRSEAAARLMRKSKKQDDPDEAEAAAEKKRRHARNISTIGQALQALGDSSGDYDPMMEFMQRPQV